MSEIQSSLLGNFVEQINGGGTPSRDVPEYWNGDIPWVSVKDLFSSNPELTAERITGKGLASSASRLVPAGIPIVATRMAVGRTAAFPIDVAINQDLKAIFPNEKLLHRRYLFHFLKANEETLASKGTGSTVKGIRLEDLENLPIFIPPLPEQKKIAEILSGIDLAIGGIKSKIEKLRCARVALAESELRGSRHVNCADSEIGVIPSHWQVKGILDVSSVASGQVDPTNINYRDMILIAPNHIESETGRILSLETAIQQGATSGKYFAQQGSVILSKIRPNLAKVCIAIQGCLTSADMYPITAGREITPGYLKQVLLSKRFTKYATESSVRGNIPKINRDELSGYRLALPPLDEQKAIVSRIESIEKAIVKEDDKVALLLDLKSSLSSDFLSGRKRVTL